MIEIEKPDSAPPPPGKAGRKPIYRFADMNVGDRFRVPDGKRASVEVRAYVVGKQLDRQFGIRTIDGVAYAYRLA